MRLQEIKQEEKENENRAASSRTQDKEIRSVSTSRTQDKETEYINARDYALNAIPPPGSEITYVRVTI